jgi:hypothetical protein
LFALIAGRPSRLAPVAKQDGLSNGAAALEHFSAVSASLNVLAKLIQIKADDALKEHHFAAIRTIHDESLYVESREMTE